MSEAVFEVEAGGRTWKLGRATGESRKAMIAAVAQLAWKNIAELQTLVPDAYAEARDAFSREVGSEQHKPGGRLWEAHTRGPASTSLFVYSLLKPNHPDCTLGDARELLAAKPDDVSAAVAALVPGFFEMLAGHPETPPEYRAAFREAAKRAADTLA